MSAGLQKLKNVYGKEETLQGIFGVFTAIMAILTVVTIAYAIKNNKSCTKDDKKDRYDAVLKFSIGITVVLIMYGLLTFFNSDKLADTLFMLGVSSMGLSAVYMGLYHKKDDCEITNKKTIYTTGGLILGITVLSIGYLTYKSGSIEKLKDSIKTNVASLRAAEGAL